MWLAGRLGGLEVVCVVDGEEYRDGTDGRAQLRDGAHPDQRLAALGTHDGGDAQLNVANDAQHKCPGGDLQEIKGLQMGSRIWIHPS